MSINPHSESYCNEFTLSFREIMWLLYAFKERSCDDHLEMWGLYSFREILWGLYSHSERAVVTALIQRAVVTVLIQRESCSDCSHSERESCSDCSHSERERAVVTVLIQREL